MRGGHEGEEVGCGHAVDFGKGRTHEAVVYVEIGGDDCREQSEVFKVVAFGPGKGQRAEREVILGSGRVRYDFYV